MSTLSEKVNFPVLLVAHCPVLPPPLLLPGHDWCGPVAESLVDWLVVWKNHSVPDCVSVWEHPAVTRCPDNKSPTFTPWISLQIWKCNNRLCQWWAVTPKYRYNRKHYVKVFPGTVVAAKPMCGKVLNGEENLLELWLTQLVAPM